MVKEYFSSGDMDAFSLGTDKKNQGGGGGGARTRAGNPLLLYTDRSGSNYAVHYGSFPPDAFPMDWSYIKGKDKGCTAVRPSVIPCYLGGLSVCLAEIVGIVV